MRHLAHALLLVGEREINHGYLLDFKVWRAPLGVVALSRLTSQSTSTPGRVADYGDAANGGRFRREICLVRDTVSMQSSFGTVLWVVCAFAIVAAFISLAGTGKTWDEYGKSRLLMESDLPTRALTMAAATAQSNAERDLEIRQMLEARNARRARRGEPP